MHAGQIIERTGDVVAMAMEGCDIAHCISGDIYMEKGIAGILDKRFRLREQLAALPAESRRVGCVIETRREVYPGKVISIFNMVTKAECQQLPTYETVRKALIALRAFCDDYAPSRRLEKSIGVLTMPRIGCGIDRLVWESDEECVKGIIFDVFDGCEVDVRILTLGQ
jgi:hypothetical protein